MLNRAARFFPILEELKRQLPQGGALLEVGSGSLGLGEFWKGPFVGCDVSFSSAPVNNMLAVRCSGHQLPFDGSSFDVVVASDVMEHVPPMLRRQFLSEVLRVARGTAILGYPCGPAAFALDQRLYREYQGRNLPPPVWLEEHMLHPFPDEELFSELPMGWVQKVIPNESLRFHYWLMRAEMFRLLNYASGIALRVVPRMVERVLRPANYEPSYRKIFVLTRQSDPACA